MGIMIRGDRIRYLIVILFLLSTVITVCQSNKLDSKKRFPSRRRTPRQNVDPYANEIPTEDYRYDKRSYPDDSRNIPDERTFSRREYDDYPLEEEEPIPYVQEDLVVQYTSSITSKIMVSVCSGFCCTILVSILMKMLISRIYLVAVLPISLICMLSCFSKNKNNSDVTEFSKALGVFFFLLLKKSQPTALLSQFFVQAKAATLLSSRKQFPPTENPWKHVYYPEDKDSINFKMFNSLIGIVVIGTLTGWSVSSYVPLLPGWLGAVGCAGFLGYLGTLKDSLGDMLRFVGYSLDQYLAYLLLISNDVYLWEKATVLFQRIFSIILRFEKRNKIIERLSFYFGKIILILTSFFKSVRSDIDADAKEERE